MREIKFRGKKDNEWVYGFYHKCITSESIVIVRIVEQHHIYTRDFDYIVDGNSVGQYTGLKDKNGKEIYEGDIVKIEYDGISAVIFDEGAFCWCEYSEYYADGKFCHSFNDLEYYHSCNEIEVIGNIYDNPKLLEENKWNG